MTVLRNEDPVVGLFNAISILKSCNIRVQFRGINVAFFWYNIKDRMPDVRLTPSIQNFDR